MSRLSIWARCSYWPGNAWSVWEAGVWARLPGPWAGGWAGGHKEPRPGSGLMLPPRSGWSPAEAVGTQSPRCKAGGARARDCSWGRLLLLSDPWQVEKAAYFRNDHTGPHSRSLKVALIWSIGILFPCLQKCPGKPGSWHFTSLLPAQPVYVALPGPVCGGGEEPRLVWGGALQGRVQRVVKGR